MQTALETFDSAENPILIGSGPQCKDSCYRVYQVDDKYIAIIIAGLNNDIVHAEFITKNQIGQYVEVEE